MNRDVEFLKRALAWPGSEDDPGFINLYWTAPAPRDPNKIIWIGRPTRGVGEFIKLMTWAQRLPTSRDIFMCMSRQGRVGYNAKGALKAAKTQDDALLLRAIWIDVDVKAAPKGYPDQTAALQAIGKFCKDTGLPDPSALVNSGGGIHVYWFSDRPLSCEEWHPFASGLKTLLLKHNLLCDAGITDDAARVLRPPGTFNYKLAERRPVTLLGMREFDYDFETTLGWLKQHAAEPRVAIGTPAPFLFLEGPQKLASMFQGAPSESLSDGIDPEDHPLIPAAPVLKQCAFLREGLFTGGKDYAQPLWNLSTLAATFLEDGHAIAHKMGNKHPGYTQASTDELWDRKIRERKDRNLGWPSCNAIHAAGCKSCQTCPLFPKGKSPLHLVSAAAAAAAVTAAVIPSGVGAVAATLPPGYELDKNGYITRVVPVYIKGELTSDVEHIKLFNCKLSLPWAQKTDEGKSYLNFTTTVDKGNIQQVAIPLMALHNSSEMFKVLLDHNVKYDPDGKKYMEHFLMSWITKLHDAQAAQRALPFGWLIGDGQKYPTGFVYGGVLMQDDGSIHPSGLGDQNLRNVFAPHGQLAPWYEAFKMITDQKRPELEVIVAAAFGAPLMRSSGQKSSLFSAWSSGSGLGKSTAVDIGLAVWGNPQHKETKKSTSKSIAHKMGEIHNLPVYWDEITEEKVQEELFQLLFTATEGIEGSRLYSNITHRPRGTWKTILCSCSNMSFMDFLISKQKTTPAGLMRVFEFEVRPRTSDLGVRSVSEVGRMTQLLETNHGVIGMEYAKLLGAHPVKMLQFAEQEITQWEQKVTVTPDERMWSACVGCTLAGAKLANKYLNTNFDLEAMEQFLYDRFLELRKRVKNAAVIGGSQMNTEDALGQFLKHANKNTIHTDTCAMGPGKPKAVNILHGPSYEYPQPIYVQWAIGPNLLRISREALETFLTLRKHPHRPVFDGLATHFQAVQKRQNLCAGTSFVSLPEPIFEIPVSPGSDLHVLMMAYKNDRDVGVTNGKALVPAPVVASPAA